MTRRFPDPLPVSSPPSYRASPNASMRPHRPQPTASPSSASSSSARAGTTTASSNSNSSKSPQLPPPPSSVDRRLTPQRQRFSAQHDPVVGTQPRRTVTPELSPRRNSATAALQFVPAWEEAAKTAQTTNARDDESAVEGGVETSWEALVEEEKKEILDYRNPAVSHSAGSHVGSGTSTHSCLTKPKKVWPSSQPRRVHPSEGDPDGAREDDAPSVVSSSLRPSSQSRTGNGARISRLASLFSSRAVVRTGGAVAASPLSPSASESGAASRRRPSTSSSRGPASGAVAPPSPSYSSSSSGYVGWPGTQDKRGATVAPVPSSSYEESSCAGGTRGSGGAGLPPTSVPGERALQEAAAREMQRGWSPPSQPTNPAPQSAEPRARSASPLLEHSLSSSRYAKNGLSPQRIKALEPARTTAEPRNSLRVHALFPSEHADDAGLGAAAHLWGAKSEPSSPGRHSASSYSKTSSAYLQVTVDDARRQLSYPDLSVAREAVHHQPPTVHSRTSRKLEPPPQFSLEHPEPLVRSFPARGYRGLLDKTQEVPSLMDDVDSESNASSSRAPSTHSSVVPPTRHQQQPANALNGLLTRRSGRPLPGDVLDARASWGAESDVFDGISLSKESDVFDGLSQFDSRSGVNSPRKAAAASRSRASFYPERIAEEDDDEAVPATTDDFQMVVLPGGLATIQSTSLGFNNRKTASDYDENLTNSDVDQYGFARTPGFNEMLSAGTRRDNSLLGIDGNIGKNPNRNNRPREVVESSTTEEVTSSESGSGSSLFSDPYRFDNDHLSVEGDLSEYYIPASRMKKVLRHYRKLSDVIRDGISLEEFEREDDEHKAFALFEMRSRIMEKDIERGLERRGGTVPVDDLVTTPYFLTSHRVRDAVIVSKAWRDGASPQDVVNSAILTRRSEHTYYVRRPVRAESSFHSDSGSTVSGMTSAHGPRSYWWEPVEWLDDTDFMLYRCPSLGPRNMRGSEMFTIGDCQSMLLKLTNEQCINLRRELNAATQRQIEAEYLLTNDGDVSDGMMTEAEMAYLSAMEEVKEISKKLVCAEQAFNLVKDRIQRLVARYEHFLAKIDTESYAGASSVITYESSYYSEVESDVWEERERAVWARRAQRAEVKAELAAREALLAKKEARIFQEEKQRELEALQQKLLELQSESSFHAVDQEHSATLAKNYAMHRHDDLPQQAVGAQSERQKIDDVKKRFRDRMAARKQATPVAPNHPQALLPAAATGKFGQLHANPAKASTSASAPSSVRDLVRSAGEEMYQQLDFYERSLRAVERDERYAP